MPDIFSSATRALTTAFGGGVRPIVSSSNDAQAGWMRPTHSQLEKIAEISKARVEQSKNFLAAEYRANGIAPEEAEDYALLSEIAMRKGQLESEQARLRDLFRRFDNLYYPDSMSEPGGADHWPDGRKQGRVHISVNTPPAYVDIPAALQAVPPVENYIGADSSDEEREAAARAERLYFQWKDDTDFETEVHKGCLVKGLYGFTFAKVWWDADRKIPVVRILDQPENLYVGWGDSDYRRIDWTVYCYGMSPQAAAEDYGVEVSPIPVGDGNYAAYVTGTHDDPIRTLYPNQADEAQGGRLRTAYEQTQVEVYDYWYKKVVKGKTEVWNAIFVGNRLVENARHKEYNDLPYIPLRNTYIPGSPYGRPDLLDLEQLFREKDERLSEAGQMIHSIVAGQMWQLVGPEAGEEVPANAIPKPNKVAAPGPGSEIKALQPFVPQFAVEDYLKRIDGEIETVSGLNDLLIGRAPATILGSSKAITALVANYEARIRMRRQLLYRWRKDVWAAVATVWEAKDKDIREILDGRHRLHIVEPELTPRDQLENAQKAINLVQNRLWSMRRAMDQTGVEDPEDELNLIRQEQTDPALNPAAVQAQVSLAAGMQALGMPMPGGAEGAPATQEQTENTARTLNRPAAGGESLNAPENQGNPPPEAQPENARGAGQALAQTMVQDGEASGRLVTQVPIGG
jgi:hypothetical protein